MALALTTFASLMVMAAVLAENLDDVVLGNLVEGDKLSKVNFFDFTASHPGIVCRVEKTFSTRSSGQSPGFIMQHVKISPRLGFNESRTTARITDGGPGSKSITVEFATLPWRGGPFPESLEQFTVSMSGRTAQNSKERAQDESRQIQEMIREILAKNSKNDRT